MKTISRVSQALLVLSGAPLYAGSLSYSVLVPASSVPSSPSVQVAAFDPALGVLRLVHVSIGGTISGSFGLENTTATRP